MSTAMVDIARHKIQPLNAVNYAIWSKKMQLLLKGKGLWNIVCGKETTPTETQVEEYRKHIQRRDVALTDILLSIEDNCSHAVISLEDPKDVWDKLNDMYKGVSDACVDSYLMKLQNLKMKDDEMVMTYVNRLTEIENQLAAVGHKLEEGDKKRSLLRGLREKFAITARVIRAMDMSFTKVISELVIEEGARETEQPTDEGGSKALATIPGPKHHCSHCGREGHTADRCFHNPTSTYYRKNFSGKSWKRQKHPNYKGSWKNKKRGDNSDRNSDDVANIALMSRSVWRGEVSLPSSKKAKWFVDSASTSHICNDEEKFESLQKQSCRPVEVGEGQLVNVHGIGKIQGTTVVDGRRQKVTMRDVLYVPTMICNLISVSKARRSGFKVTFDGDDNDNGFCEIRHKRTNSVYVRGIEQSDGLYEAVFQADGKPKTMMSTTAKQSVWHERLAQVSSSVMQKTIPLVKGIDLQSVRHNPNQKCVNCQIGKPSRKPRPLATEESRKSTAPLDLVHADVVGPMKHTSFSGKKYFIPLYDDSTAVSMVRFLTSKSEASQAIKEMITELETIRKCAVKHLIITSYEQERVRRLRTDNAKELLSRSFKLWLKEKGIHHELTSAYSPESNGKAERLNRTLLDMSRTMLLSAKHLPKNEKLWAEAVNTACYVRNRLFSSAASDPTKTPYEMLLNKKPDLSHIRVFGSKSYVHIPKSKRKGKFSARANVGYLVGYERGNSYRVFLPSEGKTVVSRDVTIGEGAQQSPESNATVHLKRTDKYQQFDDPFKPFLLDDSQDVQEDDAEEDEGYGDGIQEDDAQDGSDEDDPDVLENVTHYPEVRRSSRVRKPPARLGYDTAMFLQQARMKNDAVTTPLTFTEAISRPDGSEWKAVMDEECRIVVVP